jgi:hypothetical protein
VRWTPAAFTIVPLLLAFTIDFAAQTATGNPVRVNKTAAPTVKVTASGSHIKSSIRELKEKVDHNWPSVGVAAYFGLTFELETI